MFLANTLTLTLVVLMSRFGDKTLKIEVVCSQFGTAVLKRLTLLGLQRAKNDNYSSCHLREKKKAVIRRLETLAYS